MARLRSYHPALASEIERMLEEIIVKFKPAPQEELESAVHALLSKCFQLPMSTNSIPESLQNTLRRVCVKFFSEETSKKSERHRLFVAEYKVPFERDLFPVNNDRFPKTLDEVVKKLNTWKNILTRRVQSEPKSVAMACSHTESIEAMSWNWVSTTRQVTANLVPNCILVFRVSLNVWTSFTRTDTPPED